MFKTSTQETVRYMYLEIAMQEKLVFQKGWNKWTMYLIIVILDIYGSFPKVTQKFIISRNIRM